VADDVRERLLATATGMALALAVAVGGLLATAIFVAVVTLRNTRRSSDDTLRFDAPVRELSFRLDAGNVTITGTEHDGAVVRRSLRHGWRTPLVRQDLRHGDLRVEAHRPSGFLAGWWWVGYEVDVARRASATVETTAGRVTIAGLTGAVDVQTGAGKVHVREMSGSLRVRVAAGSVEGESLTSRSVEVHADAGHVRLSFDEAPDNVTVSAAAGAVEIRLPGGPYRVDAQSTAGRVHVEVPNAPDAPRTVEVRSEAGSVRLSSRLAGRARVELTAEPLGSADGRALVDALLAELYGRYGEEDADAPDAGALAPPNGVFLVARLDGRAVGCGGLRRVDAGVGEIKRMYVMAGARRLGIGGQILRELEGQARRLGLERLRLETGVRQPEAIGLYERAGYERIENFPPYTDAPLSVCYAKDLPDT
jgi:putative acetyltransferase